MASVWRRMRSTAEVHRAFCANIDIGIIEHPVAATRTCVIHRCHEYARCHSTSTGRGHNNCTLDTAPVPGIRRSQGQSGRKAQRWAARHVHRIACVQPRCSLQGRCPSTWRDTWPHLEKYQLESSCIVSKGKVYVSGGSAHARVDLDQNMPVPL